MRYMFFDVEGANCYNFVSKMCTFGYVITDDSYNVINKIDVIINPESPFDRHILHEKMNAYPVDTYIQRPAFNYFYTSIKHLLEEEEQIIVGWSIENDVKYVYDACKRYHKRQIKYKYFDVQKVYEIMENLSNAIKLETACNNLGINTLVTHKSDDDAYMTMEVTKKICEKENLTLDELIIKYPTCLSDVETFSKNVITDKEIALRTNRRAVYKKMKFTPNVSRKSELFNEETTLFFSVEAIDKFYDSIKSIIAYAGSCGAKFTKEHKCMTMYVGTKKDIASHKGNELFDNIKKIEIKKLIEKVEEEKRKV